MNDSVPFSRVFKDELRAIEKRRRSLAEATVRASSTAVNGNQAQDAREHCPVEGSGAPLAGSGENCTDQDLVGLALSGGGVRSASFNLGLIQALDLHGVFAQVDYLSTVSGGGFVGGYISSLSLDPKTSTSERPRSSSEESENGATIDRTEAIATRGRASTETNHNRFERNITDLAPGDDEPQPKRVLELIYSGDYLRLPLDFLNRYFIGLVFITGFWVSGVFTVAAGLAWLFRTLDGNQARYFLRALGFYDDLARAFFPSVVFGIVWLLAWGLSYWQSRGATTGRTARVFLACLVASLLIACAMLLGTGSIDMQKFASYLHIPSNEKTISTIQNFLKALVIVPLFLFLLPYFRPSQLLKSGRAAGAKWWERAIFRFAGLALLIGVPLLVFGIFARENISNWNEERTGLLAANDVNWRELTHRMNRSRNGTLGAKLWNTKWEFSNDSELRRFTPVGRDKENSAVDLSEGIYDSVRLYEIANEYIKEIKNQPDRMQTEVTFADFAAQIEQLEKNIEEKDDSLPFHQRWVHLAEWLVAKTRPNGDEEIAKENELYQLYKWRRDEYFLQLAALAIINRVALLDDELSSTIRRELQWPLTAQNEFVGADLGEICSDIELLVEPEPPIKQLADMNRRLLTAYFGQYGPENNNVVQAKGDKLSLTVVLQKDQESRLYIFWWALAIFLVLGFVLNLNLTSLQGYYRNQVANMWIASVGGFHRQIPLARLDTTAKGHPYHLICTTANFIRRQEREKGSTDHFLFSNLYCGSDRTGYRPTTTFCGGTYDLASAIALSGAAVSPAQVNNLLLVILMFIMNLRLGQWLPNPGHKAWWPTLLSRALSRWPSPFLVLASLSRRSQNRAYCLVTDGGHFENLGIGALLNRRCRLIISSDAGYDPDYKFVELSSLLRRERIDHGVQIHALDGGVANIDSLLPDESKRLSKAHWVIARIDYPSKATSHLPRSHPGASSGYLIYIRPTFVNDEELDVESQRRVNPDFPHDSTSDQFYSPDKFESYRQLGFNIGTRLCNRCFQDAPLRTWTPDDVSHESPSKDQPPAVSSQDGLAPARGSSQDNIVEAIERMCDNDPGHAKTRREAAEFLAEKLIDEASDISQTERMRIAESMVDVFRTPDKEVQLRLILAETLKKVPRESHMLVRQKAIDIVCEKEEHTEIRLAALHVLDVIGLGRNETNRNRVEKLRDDPEVDAQIREAARQVLRPHAQSNPN